MSDQTVCDYCNEKVSEAKGWLHVERRGLLVENSRSGDQDFCSATCLLSVVVRLAEGEMEWALQ